MLPEDGKLWDAVMASPSPGHIRFELPAGRRRKTRCIEQEVRVEPVEPSDRQGGRIEAMGLIAR